MVQKLLIIDDAQDVHRLICARLQNEPYQIRSAYDAESGLEMLRAFAPDLVLLDVDLPGQDGFALCQCIKADPRTARTPVVFLTAADTIEQKVRGLELGAVDFITKPFDPAELRARVRASLRTKSLIDDLARTRVTTFLREAVATVSAGVGASGRAVAATPSSR